MPSVQVRDILDSIRGFYGELSDRFRAEQQRLDGEPLSYLLQYLSVHEQELEQSIAKFEDDADAAVLDTWLQFGADDTLDEALKGLDLHPGMTSDDIVGEALKVDTRLIELYKELAGESSVGHVSELFEGLARMQEARERQLAYHTLD